MKFEIVLIHKADESQLQRLIDAIRPPAPPVVEAPPPVVPEAEKAFLDWLEEQGFVYAKESHYKAAFDIITGRRNVPQGFTRASLRAELAEAGAPLP